MVGAGGALADRDADEKDEVREGEEGEGDPEIEEEVGVECVAVLGGVDGQVPEAVGGRDGLGCLHGLIVVGRAQRLWCEKQTADPSLRRRMTI